MDNIPQHNQNENNFMEYIIKKDVNLNIKIK
jgi:hypothetical protein